MFVAGNLSAAPGPNSWGEGTENYEGTVRRTQYSAPSVLRALSSLPSSMAGGSHRATTRLGYPFTTRLIPSLIVSAPKLRSSPTRRFVRRR
jgi:hypothetical protein